MKKNYLVVLGILMFLLPLSVAGQELVWSNTFDTPADLQGWTIHDLDGNNNSWTQGKNHIMVNNGTENVLRYSWLNENNTIVTGYQTDNDWIISPEIDLTNASGAITFAAYISRGNPNSVYGLGRNLYIYESTAANPVPTLADFQAMTLGSNGMYDPSYPYFFYAGTSDNPWVSPNTDFNECLVDISAFAGKKIYFALWTYASTNLGGNNSNIGMININEMAIYADNLSAGVSVTGVSLNKATLSLVAGTNETLAATVAPADATNKEVTWASSNEAVATVDVTGKVTAVAAGTAEITITTKDGGKTAKCTVTVTAAVDYSWLKAAAIAVEGNFAKVVGPDAANFTRFYINDQSVELTSGQADLTGKAGELSLKATSADASSIIRLKISK